MHLPRLWTDAPVVKTTQVKMQGGTNQMEEPLVGHDRGKKGPTQ